MDSADTIYFGVRFDAAEDLGDGVFVVFGGVVADETSFDDLLEPREVQEVLEFGSCKEEFFDVRSELFRGW